MKDDLDNRLKQLQHERSQIIQPTNKVYTDIMEDFNNLDLDLNNKELNQELDKEFNNKEFNNQELNKKLNNLKKIERPSYKKELKFQNELRYNPIIEIKREKKNYEELYKNLTSDQVKLLLIKNGYI